MNVYPPFTNIRSYASYQFSALRMRALRHSLWTKISHRNTKLAVFPEEAPEKSPNRRFISVQEISVHHIIGTISRQGDFDHKFRPLKNYLRDRWVNTYMTLQGEGWPPILVHKVGNKYYVEDGHHRVSVAKSLGIVFIQAMVWEYPYSPKEPKNCQPDGLERSSIQVYARVIK